MSAALETLAAAICKGDTRAVEVLLEVVRLLRSHGADLSARTDDDKTAADLAAERGHAVLSESLRGGS